MPKINQIDLKLVTTANQSHLPVLRHESKKLKFSENEPNTLPSTASSRFICVVVDFRAARSSVWISPFNEIKIVLDAKTLS